MALQVQPQDKTVMEIPRAAHTVFEDNPGAFLPAVWAFLHRHEP